MTSRQELGEQLLGVLDGAPEPLVVIGRDGTYLYANDAARDLLGMADDPVGRDARALHPDVAGTELAAAGRRVMDGDPAEVVDLHYPPLGIDLQARLMPIADGVAVALLDVTEPGGSSVRRLHEPDLYQQVIDHANSGMTMSDPEGRFLVVNRTAAEMIGRPIEDLVGRTLEDLYEPGFAAELRAVLRQAEVTRAPVRLEPIERLHRERGREVVLHVFPVYDRDGRFMGTARTGTDVTELMHAERALVAAQERYRAIFTGSSLALIVARPRGLIVEANAAACKLLGYSRAQLLAISPRELVGDDPETVERWRARMLVDGRLGFEAEEEYIRSDGRRIPVLLTVKLIDDPEGGELISLVARDQSRLKELQTELVRAERMEAAGRLAAGVAHDANNILAAVQGYAQMLSRDVGENARAQRHLAGILRSVDRAGDMVHQLLAFTRSQDLAASDVDLAALVADQEDMLRRLLPQEVSLDLELAAAPVRADASQVGRVLVNLVVNARHAVDGNGAIRIRTAIEEAAGDDVLRAGRYAVLTVTDDGHGMDPGTAQRCFEPFFTTRPPGVGTGLGLSIAHGVARQSGGDLRVRTAPGQGSEFRLLLPAASVEVEPPAVRRDGDERAATRVLVVDDDISSRAIVRALLRRHGYVVIEAGDGQEALAVAATESDVDLVVSDLQMPHVDGVALAAALRATSSGVPFLLMSGAASPPPGWEGPFLHKPFREQQLLEAVTAALARRPA